MVDQLAAPALPAYGHSVVKTPHLDRLARRSVVFDSAYCNFPICAPSRASLLTGRLPHGIEAWDNASEFPAAVPTMAHYLPLLESDALETLAVNPVQYLVVPRVVASAAMFPIVVGSAMLVGLVSGWGASLVLLDLTTPQFLKGVRLFFEPFDVRYGLVKSASFGAAVALIGCRAGLSTTGGAQGVGRSATQAVVISAVMILVLDAFWALVWLTGRTIR
jgi:hypothetical protein